MKHISHVNTVTHILSLYKGDKPFAIFIKDFFRLQKKFGSTDRKVISNCCYCYFRLGHSLKNISVQEKILIGIFLCDDKQNELLNHFKPGWNKMIHLPLAKKLSAINAEFSIADVFPWKEKLSEGIDHEKFCRSFLTQPDLFLRIRPGKEKIILKKLEDAKIDFTKIGDSCIALSNATKIDQILNINDEVVIQDYSSQRIKELFSRTTRQSPLSVWDCCAGSGGKSIMLFDFDKNINLTVSDIRESILVNLKKRFAEAGIKKYTSFLTDLSITNNKLSTKNYDLVLADVPCTGSGTWCRTPESLLFFTEKEIERFSELQKKILSNIIPSLKKHGCLIYITCSVFKKENEDMVEFIQQKHQLKLQKTELLKGYEIKADSMFAAVFTV